MATSIPYLAASDQLAPIALCTSSSIGLCVNGNAVCRSERRLSVSEILMGWRPVRKCIGPSLGFPSSGSHGDVPRSMTLAARSFRIHQIRIPVKCLITCANIADLTFHGGFCRLTCAMR